MKKTGRLLIVIGIILILIPILGRIYVSYEQQQLYEAYLKTINENKEEQEESHVVSEPIQTIEKEEAPVQEDWQPPKTVTKGETIGRIIIDKIDLNLILLEGVDNSSLGMGAGHMPDTALPGQPGNCAIAGHRNYTFGSMFNRLDEVAVGDEIILELMGKSFTYKVTETEIIDPADLSVIAQDETVKEVTLITCHPVYSSAYRLIIKGKLIS